MAFLKEAVETVAALQSPIEREIYGNKAAAAAGISAGAFAQEVERFRKNRAWQARKKQARRELTPAAQLQPRERELRYENLRSARAEEGVVRLLLLEPDLFPQVEGLGPEQFSAPVLAKIYALAVPAPPGGALHPVGPPSPGALPGGDEPPGERDGISPEALGAQRPGPAGLHRDH